jgi:hypothetical protein
MESIALSHNYRESQIDRCISCMMQIPGSWDLNVLNVAFTLKNALQAMGINISSEHAYHKVVQYANKH